MADDAAAPGSAAEVERGFDLVWKALDAMDEGREDDLGIDEMDRDTLLLFACTLVGVTLRAIEAVALVLPGVTTTKMRQIMRRAASANLARHNDDGEAVQE